MTGELVKIEVLLLKADKEDLTTSDLKVVCDSINESGSMRYRMKVWMRLQKNVKKLFAAHPFIEQAMLEASRSPKA